MGFSVNYRTTRPVTSAQAAAIKRAAEKLARGRTWLSCEPPFFSQSPDDGHLGGGCKPNFNPDSIDAAAAANEGLPDGTTQDMIDILCELSRAHDVDWEISHDYSDGPIG